MPFISFYHKNCHQCLDVPPLAPIVAAQGVIWLYIYLGLPWMLDSVPEVGEKNDSYLWLDGMTSWEISHSMLYSLVD